MRRASAVLFGNSARAAGPAGLYSRADYRHENRQGARPDARYPGPHSLAITRSSARNSSDGGIVSPSSVFRRTHLEKEPPGLAELSSAGGIVADQWAISADTSWTTGLLQCARGSSISSDASARRDGHLRNLGLPNHRQRGLSEAAGAASRAERDAVGRPRPLV